MGIGAAMSGTWISAWTAYPKEMVAAGAYSPAKTFLGGQVPMTSITGELLPGNRVAAIISPDSQSFWVLALKESSHIPESKGPAP